MAEGEAFAFQLCRNPLTYLSSNRKTNTRYRKLDEMLACSSSFWNPSKKTEKLKRYNHKIQINDSLSEFIVTVKRKDGAIMNRQASSELQSSLEKREVFQKHRRRSRVWANKEGAGCSLQTPEKRRQEKQNICSRGYQRWRSKRSLRE